MHFACAGSDAQVDEESESSDGGEEDEISSDEGVRKRRPQRNAAPAVATRASTRPTRASARVMSGERERGDERCYGASPGSGRARTFTRARICWVHQHKFSECAGKAIKGVFSR